jgi:hypothetical protein
LIKINATEICYSDIHYMLNDLGSRRMSASNIRSAGHEGAGVVAKLGENVKGWKVGDRAGVEPYGTYAGRASCVGMIRSAIAQVLLLQDSHQVNIFLKPEVKHSVILVANFHRHVPTVHCLTSQIYLPDPRRRIRLHSRPYNMLC